MQKQQDIQESILQIKDRIKEILPDISTENILGAGYTEDDGYFDGTMISNTYMKKSSEKWRNCKRQA